MEGGQVSAKCTRMCPDTEITMRIREKLVHFYERGVNGEPCPEKMVKEYKRSAAGITLCDQNDLRTFETLQTTVNYLLTNVIKDERKPYNHVYDFIFDRLRCVRQEIVICNLPAADTVSLLEPMIIFLAYSYYQLSEEQIANFDPKICGQHLQECLKKTLTCYDEMTGRKTKYPSSRRPLIESIYLVFNLGSEEAMQRGLYIQSDLELKFEDCVRSSWTISRCCWQGNYYRALKSMWQLPCILQGLIYAKHVQGWRQRLLNSLSSAYSSPNVSIPFDFLIRITCLDETHLKTFCSHVNIEINSPNSVVKFNKKSHLYETPPPRPRKEIQISHSSI